MDDLEDLESDEKFAVESSGGEAEEESDSYEIDGEMGDRTPVQVHNEREPDLENEEGQFNADLHGDNEDVVDIDEHVSPKQDISRHGSMFHKEASIDQAEDSDSEFGDSQSANVLTKQDSRLNLMAERHEDEDVLGLSAGPLEQKSVSEAYFRDHQVNSRMEIQSPDPDIKPSRIPVPTDEQGIMYEQDDDDESGDDSQHDHLGDSNQSVIPMEGEYDPSEFQHLPVSSEIKDLFIYIGAYRAQTVDIEPLLKPFILDFIPAVGDIDAFIKIPRPDEVEDNLGLTVLDEPCAEQSDPTVLGLQLRALNKEAAGTNEIKEKEEIVSKQLTRADKNPREIDDWIKNMNDLHGSKPATNVHYSKPMPDIDSLMKEWPAEVEEMLKKVELPTADMDIKLEDYVDIICSILDIPVHKGKRINSLHVLFTLYSEFKNSQHFRALAQQNQLDNSMHGGRINDTKNSDRLEL